MRENYRYSCQNGTKRRVIGQSQSGQIIVEYVLLLVIAITIAFLITKTMVGREQGNEGFIIKAWQGLIEQIGKDPADDLPADSGNK